MLKWELFPETDDFVLLPNARKVNCCPPVIVSKSVEMLSTICQFCRNEENSTGARGRPQSLVGVLPQVLQLCNVKGPLCGQYNDSGGSHVNIMLLSAQTSQPRLCPSMAFIWLMHAATSQSGCLVNKNMSHLQLHVSLALNNQTDH